MNTKDAVNEMVITESGCTITISVVVSGEGTTYSDRSRVEWYGEEIINKLFVKSAKRHGARRVELTKIHERKSMDLSGMRP